MKKFLLAGVFVAGMAGLAGAQETRFEVVQGSLPGEPGKNAPVPVVIKVDTGTGETWRLLVTNGNYWWIPVKNGVIKSQAAAEDRSERGTSHARLA